VVRFANDLCTARTPSNPWCPYGTLSLANQIWEIAPRRKCIALTASESGDSVATGENFSGAGILVVKDAELVASAAFHWEGLIVVTGNDIDFE
jgi:hypothetical protein